jgi:hypothetical protein
MNRLSFMSPCHRGSLLSEKIDSVDLGRACETCVEKTRRNIVRLADEPKSHAFAVDGNGFNLAEGFFGIGNWTSSFFTGMALLAFGTTRSRFVPRG